MLISMLIQGEHQQDVSPVILTRRNIIGKLREPMRCRTLLPFDALVAELVDAQHSGCCACMGVEVRVLSRAL